MKGAQHKDPAMLPPIEGEASQQGSFYFFSFTFREGEQRKNKQQKNVKRVVSRLVGRGRCGAVQSYPEWTTTR